MAKERKTATELKEINASRPFLLDRVLVYALAFTVFAIPLFIWPGITEFGYGKTMFALVAVSVLSILWGLAEWRGGSRRLRIPWITLPFIGFVVAALLSLLGAINGRVAIQSLVLAVFFFLLFLLVVNVARERRDVTILLGAAVASGFLLGLYGLLQYLGVLPGADEAGIGAITSTLGNRNFLGGFLGYLLVPSIVLVVRPRSRVLRIVALGLISFSFGTLMLVEQVGPVLGLAFASMALIVGLVIFRPIEPIRRSRTWLIALFLLLVLTFLIEAPSGPLNSVVGLSQGEESRIARIWKGNAGRNRELNWWIGWEMIKAHPITGIGLGNYKLAYLPYRAVFLSTPRGSEYLDLKIPRAAQAHNEYVQAGAELGSLGLLAVAAFLTVLSMSVWKRLRRSRDESDCFDLLLFSGGVVVFLVHALVSFPAHLPASMTAVLLLLGLIHAPVYGETCVIRLRLRERAALATLGAAILIGVVVSAFAISDLAANALMGKGIRLLEQGAPAAAERTLQQSMALDFAPRQSYYLIARAQLQQGEMEHAIENLEKCFTRITAYGVYLDYADLASRLGRIDTARRAISTLLASNPDTEIEVSARFVEAQIEYIDGNPAGATRRLERLLELDSSHILARISLGGILLEEGSPADAREHFEAALTLIAERTAALEEQLASTSAPHTNEHGEVAAELRSLQQQRDQVLDRLRRIPGTQEP